MKYKIIRETLNNNFFNNISTDGKILKSKIENHPFLNNVLINRGISETEINKYLNTNSSVINSPDLLGEEALKAGVKALICSISDNQNAIVIVDCDCDGYTSSALLINYLTEVFPSWAEQHLRFINHNDKQHGLKDHLKFLLEHEEIDLVLVPDAGSNDVEECRQLSEAGKKVIILDHHLCDKNNPYAILINNQISEYPNKDFSGVGIVWQFCRAIDGLIKKDYANDYLDLVSCGLCGDMMSLKELETKHLIQKGIESENIKNPFLFYLTQKNKYSLGEKITPTGLAFYIVPFINAIVRSGTPQEKDLIFKSMLKAEAYKMIPSTKRGCKGEEEKLVEQAVRTAINVKARQKKSQDVGMKLLKSMIEKDGLLNHKILIFLLEDDSIDKNLKGLAGNKIMALYQRPVLVLSKSEDEKGKVVYQGSARGCQLSGVQNFKKVCEDTGLTTFTAGHPNAFGCGIYAENIPAFIEKTDSTLVNMADEAIYHVDFIFKSKDVNLKRAILELGKWDDLWGKDVDEPLIAVEDITITSDMVTIYSKNTNTIKIDNNQGIAFLIMRATEEEVETFTIPFGKSLSLTIVGRSNINEWMNKKSPQIFVEDYEIEKKQTMLIF